MFNITLTVTAAPELLAVLSNITNVISSAKVIEAPHADSDFREVNCSKEQTAAAITYNQPASQETAFQPQAMPVQQTIQSQQQVQTQIAPMPTSTQSYTMEQIAVAATQLMDSGRRTELVTLLSIFGVQALTALPKERYGEFATKLRAMGAKI